MLIITSCVCTLILRKALSVSGFPNEAIISEYLISHDTLPLERDLEWKRPDVKVPYYVSLVPTLLKGEGGGGGKSLGMRLPTTCTLGMCAYDA